MSITLSIINGFLLYLFGTQCTSTPISVLSYSTDAEHNGTV